MIQVEELKKKLEGIVERIGEIDKEKKASLERLDAAKERDARLDSKIAALRMERQALLADGEDTDEINAGIEEMRHKDELIEDEIAGLQAKITRLEKEEAKLSADRIITKELLLKEETARPLVDRYNELAVQIAEILTDLDETTDEFNTLQIAGRPMNALTQSSGGGAMPTIIPMLSFIDEPQKAHAFDLAKMHGQRQMKRRQEDIQQRYQGSACFECDKYLGLLALNLSTPSCSKIGGPIPADVLSGGVTCETNLLILEKQKDFYTSSVKISPIAQ
jgi:hypothetical protein